MSSIKEGDKVRYYLYNHRGDTVLVTGGDGEIIHNLSYEAYGKATDKLGYPAGSVNIETGGGSGAGGGSGVNGGSESFGGGAGGGAGASGGGVGGGSSGATSGGVGSSGGASGGGRDSVFPQLFAGAYGIRYDAKTNLHYMRYRWYSQTQIRFISLDLIRNANRYSYTNGNPIMFVDPTGLEPESVHLKLEGEKWELKKVIEENKRDITNPERIKFFPIQALRARNLDPDDHLKYNPTEAFMIEDEVSIKNGEKSIRMTDIAQNCFGLALMAGQNIILSDVDAQQILNNAYENISAYGPAFNDHITAPLNMKKGDVIVFYRRNEFYKGDKSIPDHAAVFIGYENRKKRGAIPWFIEREGDYPVFLTSWIALTNAYTSNFPFRIYRPKKNLVHYLNGKPIDRWKVYVDKINCKKVKKMINIGH